MTPFRLKMKANLYPPYLGTGIKVKYISHDFKEIIVELKLRWYNRNFVGTHFGGSIYAMTDPFYMLMLIQILGKNYIVWDKSANIEFIKPGIGRVTARFFIEDSLIEAIHENTKNGEKYLPELTIDVLDDKGEAVARVTKKLYVRRRQQSPPG